MMSLLGEFFTAQGILEMEDIKIENIKLGLVEELIHVRKLLNNGSLGAPKKVGGTREGASINRSGIMMLCAILQAYIEEVFKVCAIKVLPSLKEENSWNAYWKQIKFWGNPSAENIKKLFLKIGIVDIFQGLEWRNCKTDKIKKKLNYINTIRNGIAHGNSNIILDGKEYNITKNKLIRFKKFAKAFGKHFHDHAFKIINEEISKRDG